MKVKVSFEAEIEKPFKVVSKDPHSPITAPLSTPWAGNLWIPADAQIEYALEDGIYLPPDGKEYDCPRLRRNGTWFAWLNGEWYTSGSVDSRVRELGYTKVGQEVKT